MALSEAGSVPSLLDWTEDEVISRLSRSSPDVWDSMIEETGVVNGITLGRQPSSSAGELDKLSSEALVLILQHLDIQSLCRFMVASFRTKEVVDSMLMYQNLLKHAPSTLVILGKTHLAGCHSVLDLHAALLAADCVSCHQFGAFLFLPTCERACLDCLHRNMRFWVLPAKEAQETYGIQQKEAHRLPGMMSVPVGRRRGGRRRKLVSVRLARELGLAIRGSQQEMTAWVMRSGRVGARLNEYSWWAEAGAGSTLLDWNAEEPLRPPTSSCWGFASMRFPHLRRDQAVDPGYWCEGCRFRRRQISAVSEYSHGMDYICKSPEEEKELEERHRRELREWSRSGLKEHVLTCAGALELANFPVDEI